MHFFFSPSSLFSWPNFPVFLVLGCRDGSSKENSVTAEFRRNLSWLRSHLGPKGCYELV